MNEIDLKKTPLSEIDLTKIDYEKSYVMDEDRKHKINRIMYSEKNDKWNVYEYSYDYGDNAFWFSGTGRHRIYPKNFSLHLFYKEGVRTQSCKGCKHEYGIVDQSPCYGCLDADKWILRNWQPKESVKESNIPEHKWVKRLLNPHPIIIEYQDLGSSVKIVKIEGVMTIEDIRSHAGRSVTNEYFLYAPNMNMFERSFIKKDTLCDGKTGVYIREDIHNPLELTIGDAFPKQDFLKLIETMKLASKRLASLIKESKQPKIERIEI
jgi:hypothetical protein